MSRPIAKVNSKDLAPEHRDRPDRPRNPVHLVLDNIRSAFNVGAAFRTADAVRAEKIHLCGISAHPPNPKIEKTALGSTLSVPWQYYRTTREALETLKAEGIHICLVELTSQSVDFWEYPFPEPVAVVFGHEVFGIEDEVLPLADGFVSIPMYGQKATLNVSTAMGIVLFETIRHRELARLRAKKSSQSLDTGSAV